MRRILKGESGFTLIELMVVVLIIGILVAIAIPVFNSTQNNARRRACFANQRTMESGISQFNSEAIEFNNGSTLTSIGQLTGSTVTNGITYGPWVATLPVCPQGGSYGLSGNNWVTCSTHGHYQ